MSPEAIEVIKYLQAVVPVYMGMLLAGAVALMAWVFVVDWNHKGRFVVSTKYHGLINAGFIAWLGFAIGSFVTLNALYFF